MSTEQSASNEIVYIPAMPQQQQMQAAPAQQPTHPAGWYTNPTTGVTQWWDGYQWTHHVAPAVQQQPQQIIINTGANRQYKTSHGFHLIMSIITMGLWLPVWMIVGAVNASRNP